MYGYPARQTASSYPQKCSSAIEVMGEGTVTAAPDRVQIVLGAVTEGTELRKVQAENAATVTNIIQALLQTGLPRENIQTSVYTIEAQYDYQDGKQIFRGYKVTHLLQITSDKVEQAGLLVDTAVSHGANTVTSIRFTLARPELYENQALSLAIHNARRKAMTIAQTLGVNLASTPCRVEELAPTAQPLLYKTAQLPESPATPIQPGTITVYASVRLWYLFA